jgi:hypothetical protein
MSELSRSHRNSVAFLPCFLMSCDRCCLTSSSLSWPDSTVLTESVNSGDDKKLVDMLFTWVGAVWSCGNKQNGKFKSLLELFVNCREKLNRLRIAGDWVAGLLARLTGLELLASLIKLLLLLLELALFIPDISEFTSL